ncbi:MAG: GNAT family N-acetyltransferase [bacterium]|nr:GNAT family N-acetyltransferase [bacterium]
MLIFTTDKPRLARHFQKDPVLFSYHLGDLDDFFFPYCQFACVYHPTRAIIEEAVIVYNGGCLPAILMFGLTERFQSLMSNLVDLLPPRFHGHFQPPTREILLTRYSESKSHGKHLKMKLEDPDRLKSGEDHSFQLRRLDESDLGELRSLYQSAHPGHYFIDRMLQTGKYFGILADNAIVAVAGVHVCSAEYKIAALGNIVTHPDYRGQGMGTAITAHLTQELIAEGLTVTLNVSAENNPAIVLYEKLGFVAVHEYYAADFDLRNQEQ